MVIRRATEDDLADLVWAACDMVNESPAWEAFDPEAMRRTLGMIFKGGGVAFVAELPKRSRLAGTVVAFISTRPFSGEKFVADLGVYVAPEHRGSGLASQLVRVLEAWAREEGAVEVQLGISSQIHAERTGKLYERLGYQQTGLVFTKHIGSPDEPPPGPPEVERSANDR